MSSSDKEEPDAEAVTSLLGQQSYWDAAYADELANFREHGHAGEVWWVLPLTNDHINLYFVCLSSSLLYDTLIIIIFKFFLH